MIDLTDEKLIEQLQKGDVKSLGTLYERYKSLLFNYFLRTTGDYDLSNDLVMETFERIYKYCHSYKSHKKLRPWIFSIASNLIKDSFKKLKIVESIQENHYEIETDHPHLSLDINFRNKKLYQALNHLKPSQRNIINMYYLLEMSYEDIASCENITVNNVRIKVCRALKKMNQILKNSGL